MVSVVGETVPSIANILPGLRENSVSTGKSYGIQRHVCVPMGPPLLVDDATYLGVAFIAPCNGCQIKSAMISGAVSIASGTNTLAIDNYDASADSGRNVLSTTNIDPDTITAKEGLALTLSATATNLVMDEGDVVNFTLACGTQTTAGQGYSLHLVVTVPEII